MHPENKTWLYDILTAINEIESYFVDRPKTFDAFVSDTRTRRAVERNLEIIGEAVHRIIKKNPSVDLPDSRKIVDARNRIIHGYDIVSVEIIWSIITSYLPQLKQTVEKLLVE